MQACRNNIIARVIGRFSLLAFIFIFLFNGCYKEEAQTPLSACECENPLEEIIWLREMKNSLSECDLETSIIQGYYNGHTVFYIYITDPLFDGIQIPILYNCAGEVERNFETNNLSEFYTSVAMDTILFKCEPILK